MCPSARPRRAACRRWSAMASTIVVELGGDVPPCSSTQRRTESAAPLRTRAAVEVDAAHAGLGGERHERGARRARARGGRSAPWPARRSTGPRASRRRGSRAARPRPARLGRRRDGEERGGLPVAEVMVPVLSSSSVEQSPAASTARPLMASTLRCTSRSMPAMPMAESSAADRRRDQAHEQRDQHDRSLLGAGVDRERLQRHGREQEDDREPGEQDVERDLVRGLLALGALDEGDHAVEERLAGPGGDAHDDLVGQHPGAAGDRRAVAAGLADHRRRLAGDGRLVDAGDALDDLAVAGDHLAGRRRRTRRRARAAGSGTSSSCAVRGGRGRPSRTGSCAACRPAPCPAPRRSPRRSWRTAR